MGAEALGAHSQRSRPPLAAPAPAAMALLLQVIPLTAPHTSIIQSAPLFISPSRNHPRRRYDPHAIPIMHPSA